MSDLPVYITPEEFNKAKAERDENRRLRDQSIVNMRRSDPKYWTMQRLAKYWEMTKQNVSVILKREGVD